MSEVEVWIEEAAVELGLEIERLGKQAAIEVVRSLRERYVRDNPRAWWLDLAVPPTKYDSSEFGLSSVLPSIEGKAFLIPEIDGAELPVYRVPAAALEGLIAECPYFEYYVAGEMLEWLVAESDHNVFFVCIGKASTSALAGCPTSRF